MTADKAVHVQSDLTSALAAGASIVRSTAKFVELTLRGRQFFIIANSKTPTFAFHPDLEPVLNALGVKSTEGAHTDLAGFPRNPGKTTNLCRRVVAKSGKDRALAGI